MEPTELAHRLEGVDLTFGGRYHLNCELNRGSTAIVYEAMDLELGRKVALKVMRNNLRAMPDGTAATGAALLEAAEREVRVGERVRHPNICALLRAFHTSPAKDKLVMVWELVSGTDLLDMVNATAEGRLPEARARRYFGQLHAGVSFLHANGFCHRDLKPENVMVEARSDAVKLIDFGMSRSLASAKTMNVGTPDYMAPELLCSEAVVACATIRITGSYDARACDVWSMGALLYICVAGYFPFEDAARPGDVLRTLANVRDGRFRPLPSHASTGVKDLVQACLQTNPAKRITLDGVARHLWLVPAPAALPACLDARQAEGSKTEAPGEARAPPLWPKWLSRRSTDR